MKQTRQAGCAWAEGLMFEGTGKEVTAQWPGENDFAKVEAEV